MTDNNTPAGPQPDDPDQQPDLGPPIVPEDPGTRLKLAMASGKLQDVLRSLDPVRAKILQHRGTEPWEIGLAHLGVFLDLLLVAHSVLNLNAYNKPGSIPSPEVPEAVDALAAIQGDVSTHAPDQLPAPDAVDRVLDAWRTAALPELVDEILELDHQLDEEDLDGLDWTISRGHTGLLIDAFTVLYDQLKIGIPGVQPCRPKQLHELVLSTSN